LSDEDIEVEERRRVLKEFQANFAGREPSAAQWFDNASGWKVPV